MYIYGRSLCIFYGRSLCIFYGRSLCIFSPNNLNPFPVSGFRRDLNYSSLFFCIFTQLTMIILYWRFGTTYPPAGQAWPLKMYFFSLNRKNMGRIFAYPNFNKCFTSIRINQPTSVNNSYGICVHISFLLSSMIHAQFLTQFPCLILTTLINLSYSTFQPLSHEYFYESLWKR